MIRVEPSGQACGATVTGIDLSKPLKPEDVAGVRAAWLKHHVLAFPDQHMSDDDLERYTVAFGGFGHDPFIAPIPGRSHIIAASPLAVVCGHIPHDRVSCSILVRLVSWQSTTSTVNPDRR